MEDGIIRFDSDVVTRVTDDTSPRTSTYWVDLRIETITS